MRAGIRTQVLLFKRRWTCPRYGTLLYYCIDKFVGPCNPGFLFYRDSFFKERIATSKEQNGKVLPVEVFTHVAGTLEFQNGAIITLVMSFDVWKHSNHNIEIHGEKGSLQVPDPNGFGENVKIFKPGNDDWQSVPFSHGYTDNLRSIGVADMAYAINSNQKNRCSGDLAYHVLDVMLALIESGEKGEVISTVNQPVALPTGLANGELDM